MKTLIAIWIANRLGGRARELRRSLRDYQRHEHARIFELEQRSRGLRLYAAWVRNAKPITLSDLSESRPAPQKITTGTFHNIQAAA